MNVRRRALLRWLLFLPAGRHHSILPGIAVTVIATLLNTACQIRGVYERFEWVDLDRLLQSTSTSAGPPIVLVTIGDEEFASDRWFKGQRPLDSQMVARLVAAACQMGPAAVGVDIYTDTWAPGQLAQVKPANASCDIVWARDAVPLSADQYQLGAPAGGSPDGSVCMGLTVFQPSGDGVVREYRDRVIVKDDRSASSVPAPYATFVSSLATATAPAPAPAPAKRDKRCGFLASDVRPVGDSHAGAKIRFSSDRRFRRLAAGVLLEAGDDPGGPLMQGLSSEAVGRGAIVLIGGTFREARDTYMTPIGSLPGVEVNAHALATELSGRPIHVASWRESLVVDLIVGIGLVWLVARSRLRLIWGIALSLLLAMISTLAICYLLFSSYGFFLPVFASAAGAILGAVVDMTWQPLKREFDDFLVEYRKMSAD